MAPIGGVRAGYLSAGKDAIPDGQFDHHWRFGDGSGSTFDDNIGSNDLSGSGGITWQSDAGLDGHYLLFEGVDDVASGNAVATSDDTAFSVGGWHRPDSLDGDKNFRHVAGDEANSTGFALDVNDVFSASDVMRFQIRDGAGDPINCSGFSVSTGSWIFAVGRFTESAIELIVGDVDNDPTQVDSTSVSSFTAGSTAIQVGDSPGFDHSFEGGIDQPAVNVSAAWSDQTIQDWYDGTVDNYV